MTACTQPGCTGTIVDGYCDVCGSPAGATPFVLAEAAASASSLVPAAAEPGLTAVGRGAGVSLVPKSEGLDTTCTQPGCTGSIVDGYCDVCGSPAGAVPFVPAEAAASTGSAHEPAPTAGPVLTPAPVSVDEEISTERIPRVKMPSQPSSTQESADPGAADPGAVDAQKVDGEKVERVADDTGKVSAPSSSPRTSATAPRTIERESRRPSCPTTYVRRRCAKSASLNEAVTRAPSPTTSGSGSTRFSTCRGAPRPRTG